jgi:flagellar hook-associated protein 1 FlgK
MSLALALNTALTGLAVNQQALGVLSQNIANANTPGYSRKIINQQAETIGGQGVGVRIAEINRRVNEYLLQAIRLQSSVLGKAEAVKDYTDRTQLLLGNPGNSNNINAYMTGFFNALQSLSQTPEDATLKAGAAQGGRTLANQIAQLAQNLQDLRYQADQDIGTAITAVNSDLQQVNTLNKAITQNNILGRPSTELLDQRDVLLADLAQYMDIQTFVRENGSINVSTNGVSLLDDSLYQLTYTPVTGSSALINDGALSAIQIYRTSDTGALVGSPVTLATSGTSSTVASVMTTGKIKAFMEMRDRQIPELLQQLDMLAYNLKDRINAAHNAGSGFPGAASYTGNRLVSGIDASDWSGRVRIAVLDTNGRPVSSSHGSLPNGLPPLTLDLSLLNGGSGAGHPTVQSIINEINQYYGVPQNRLSFGNLSNVRIASNNDRLPGSPPEFDFDLDLENLSALSSNVFVTAIQVVDDTNTDITSISQNVPSVALASSGTFSTSSGSNVITVNTASAHGLVDGQTVFLPDITTAVSPATDINGIPLSELNDQFFTISNVTATSFQITVTSNASPGAAVAATGATVVPPYSQVDAGESKRTTSDGTITADLSGNSTSAYYTINLTMMVEDEQGNQSNSVVTYRIDNNQSNILNSRYAVRSATSAGTVVAPTSTQAYARALLVDADGNELQTQNGEYIASETGYLKIQTASSSYVISIDSLDSTELGDTTAAVPVDATNRGFSYYFGLNNFFADANEDDPLTNAALGLAVEQRLIDNPNLISTGRLSLVQPVGNNPPSYTYERTVGDQSNITPMAELGLVNIGFAAAGGLGAASQTFSSYSAQIISVASTRASNAKNEMDSAQLLVDGYTERENSIAGVNLDEELANTIIYQNAYAAAARIITVANDLFDTLLQSFQ